MKGIFYLPHSSFDYLDKKSRLARRKYLKRLFHLANFSFHNFSFSFMFFDCKSFIDSAVFSAICVYNDKIQIFNKVALQLTFVFILFSRLVIFI